MCKKLTERENDIYNYIVEYIKINHYAPSIRDIARDNYISVTVAKCYIDKLVDKEKLTYTPRTARSYFPVA